MHANNFAISGSNLKKLYQATYRGAGVITWGQILEGAPNKIWEDKKVHNSAWFIDFERK